MNFQAVAQNNGNKVMMFGTFNEIGGIALTQNQKQFCKCKIIDDNGEARQVRLYGTMPGPALLNTRQQFTLSTFQGNYQGNPYTGYSGFWNNKAQVNQQQNYSQSQQRQPQTPQNASQSTNYQQPTSSQQGQKPDWDAISRGKVRHGIVCACIQRGDRNPSIEEIEFWVDYIMTGAAPSKDLQWQEDEPQTSDEPSSPVDDVPF